MRSFGAIVHTGFTLRELSLPRLINEKGSSFTWLESLSMMWRVCVITFPWLSFSTMRHGNFCISTLP